MEQKRLIELLAYAKVCFEKCTSPFETTHLDKKEVNADECRDLSFKIAELIEDEVNLLLSYDEEKAKAILEQAEKEFEETQT